MCESAISVKPAEVEVAKVVLHDIEGEPLGRSSMSHADENIKSSEAFVQTLFALKGHADRATNKTTLYELHMIHFEKASFIHSEEKCKGLLEAVQILQLRALMCEVDIDKGVAKYIALFPSLRSLHWHGSGIAQHLRVIHAACTRLEQLHLHHIPGYLFPGSRVWPGVDSDPFRDACPAFQGKTAKLTCMFASICRGTEASWGKLSCAGGLAMRVNLKNSTGLSCLLGTHCRQLKKLQLHLRPKQAGDNEGGGYETISREGWLALAEAIRSASDELCKLSLRNNDYQLLEPRYETIAESVSAILEFLNERA